MIIKRFFFLTLFLPVLLLSCGKQESTKAQRKDLIDAVFASGQVSFTDEYVVAAISEGFVLQNHIKEGDQVGAKAALFKLSSEVPTLQSANAQSAYQDALNDAENNSPRLVQLRQQIEQAKQTQELDRKNLERYTALVKSNAVSQLEYDKIKLQYDNSSLQLSVLEKNLEDLKETLALNVQTSRNLLDIQKKYLSDYFIQAPLAGTVLDVYKSLGELVKKGEALAKIGSGTLITKLYIAEEDINKVKPGQKVYLSLNTEKENTYEAQVSKIYPAFNEREQSFVIEVAFVGTAPQLRSGTQVQANIVISEKKQALVLPRKFVSRENKVVNALGDTLILKTGIRNKDWVEVLEGIKEDSEIILPKK